MWWWESASVFTADTYWFQELYFWAECLSEKLHLSFLINIQLLPQPGKHMETVSLTERIFSNLWDALFYMSISV